MATKTKHTMTELRSHLFDTIEELKKPDGMEVNRAKAICDTAGRLIQTAEVEIKYQSLIARTNGSASAFLTDQR